MNVLVCLITAVAAYLLGSIPTGYLVGKAKGIDIRTVGSGNIGATNAFRILGKPAGTLVLVVDGLKGWAAAALLPGLVQGLVGGSNASGPDRTEYLAIIAGAGAVLGHVYTCWLKFKGGKGIATSAGVMAAWAPVAFVAALSTWIIICLLTRYVSVASIAAALVLPVATWLGHYGPRMVVIVGVVSALAIYKHKGNIQRLMQGTENKIGSRKGPPLNGADA